MDNFFKQTHLNTTDITSSSNNHRLSHVERKSGSFQLSPRDRDRGYSVLAMPEIPDEFPQLKQKSDAEMRAYINDPVAFQNLIKSLNIVESMVDIRDDIRDSNANQAVQTLELVCLLMLSLSSYLFYY